jgi:RNAse (barnase) inhibitor barstar
MGQAATVSTRMTDLTTALTAGAASLQAGLQDYRAQRESVSALVGELRSVVANAKTEASLTTNVLARIESSAQALSKAQAQTEQFMQGVAVVLGKAHEEFRASVTKSLDKSNGEFHQKLSSSVGLLSASIKELDDVLSTATPRGRRQ